MISEKGNFNRMENEKLIQEINKKFIELKKKLNLKIEFEEIDNIYYIKDYILNKRYVSDDFSRQIRAAISDILYSWINYLQGLLVPNPSHLGSIIENKIFTTKEEREQISKIIKKLYGLISTNNAIILTRDQLTEKKFIEDSVKMWNSHFVPELKIVMTKINESWLK